MDSFAWILRVSGSELCICAVVAMSTPADRVKEMLAQQKDLSNEEHAYGTRAMKTNKTEATPDN